MVQREMQSSSMNEDELEQLQNDILERLVVEKAVMDKAQDLQVEVSDDEISLFLLSNPRVSKMPLEISLQSCMNKPLNKPVLVPKQSTKKVDAMI